MDYGSMEFRRPRVDEDDDDVLRQHNEFLAAKHFPAAKCVRKSNETNASKPHLVERKKPESLENSASQSPIILDRVVERDVDFPSQMDMLVKMPNGFPVASRRPKNLNSKKKESIFLQQLQKSGKIISQPPATAMTSSAPGAETSRSSIIDGSGLGTAAGRIEAQKLHEENLQKLASLSNEEIMQLRSQLLPKLGSDKIKFLQSKRKVPGHEKTTIDSNQSDSQSPVGKRENLSGDPFEKAIKESKDFHRDAIILEDLPETEDITPHQSVAETVAPVQDVPVDELPINPEEAGRWLNMNQVEREKLAWMTLLPKLEPLDKNMSYTARFDFEGNLLSHEADIPTQMGLHHHSNEPEVAGYSVEELFLLARSSYQSQRITALETLAHILENHWNGRFDACFDPPLLSTLLDAGLAPLLRWALDDNTVSSIAAAVLCIHHLLVCKSDELCLDWAYCWPYGHFSPLLTATGIEQNLNLNELTDANIIKMDVITGFLRMDILPRFRYILRVLCPSSSVCELIIEICIRIVQHSLESAKQITEFPGFLEAIVIKFLPDTWDYSSQKANTSTFYYPLFSAVKLFRIISSASKELALQLVENYGVKEFLQCYLTINPSEVKLPPVKVQTLMVESLKLWHTMLSYGFCTDVYLNLHPVLIPRFTFCKSLSLNLNLEDNIANYQYAAHFMKVLQALVQNAVQPIDQNTYSGNSSALLCLDVDYFIRVGEFCLNRWLHEFSVGPTNYKGQVLLASCFSFMASICNKCFLEHQNVTLMSRVLKDLIAQYLHRCMISKEFANLVSQISSSSILLCKGTSGTKRNSNVLPSLGTILWKDDIAPLLKEGTPFPLLSAVAKFLIAVAKFDFHLAEKEIELFVRLCTEDYFLNIANLTTPFHHWFAMSEVYFIFDVISLYELMRHKRSISSPALPVTENLVYHTALTLVQSISSPNNWLLQKVFEDIIFNPRFFCTDESSSESSIVSSLNSEEQLKETCDFYLRFFVTSSMLKRSWDLHHNNIASITTYSFQHDEKLLPSSSWSFAPIVKCYQDSKTRNASGKLFTDMNCCLRWIYFISLKSQLSILNNIPLSVRFAHLCLVFLIDSEIFKEESISCLLTLLLQYVLHKKSKINLVGMNWESIPTFEEIYEELLVQYEAASFGDQCFGNFIVVALQQCYPANWKLMLFSDHEQILFFLNVPLDKLLVPIKNFLEPAETDPSLLKKYFQVVSSGKLNYCRSPLLYLMAVHHLHHYVQDKTHNTKFQQILLKSLERTKQREFYKHIICYGEPDPNSKLGFTLKENELSI